MTEEQEIQYINRYNTKEAMDCSIGVLSLKEFVQKVLDLSDEKDLSKIMICFDAGYESVTLDIVKEKSQKELDQEIEAIRLRYRQEKEKKENAEKARHKIKQLEEEIWQLKMKL